MFLPQWFSSDMRMPRTGPIESSDAGGGGGDSSIPDPQSLVVPAPEPQPAPEPIPPAPPESMDDKVTRLEREVADGQAHIGRQTSELDIYRDIVNNPAPPPMPSGGIAPPPAAPEVARYFPPEDQQAFINDPMGYLEKKFTGAENSMMNTVDERISNAQTQARDRVQTQDAIHSEFYGAHPDLKGMEDIVAIVATRVAAANPRVTDPRVLLPKVAEDAKAYIAKIRKDKPTPKTSVAGGSQMAHVTPEAKDRSEAERLKVQDYVDKKNK